MNTLSVLAKDPSAALLVVDQQYDFEPGGALAVAEGDTIIPEISEWMLAFQNVVVTQDWHPPHHISFASTYTGKKPFDLLTTTEIENSSVKSPHYSQEQILKYLKSTKGSAQVLWPDHCVQRTKGADLDTRLPLHRAQLIVRKGTRALCDSYSAFFENDGAPTGLSGYLKERQIRKVICVGLAGDYCVAWSAEDARREGFEVYFSGKLTAFVNFPENSKHQALKKLKEAGAYLI